MSASTSQPEVDAKVEKGPSGELKKTIPSKKSSPDDGHSQKDDKSTFRGPEAGAKTFNKEELKKLQVHIEIKKPKLDKEPPKVPFDPNLITPVRRPGEGRVPLFSKIVTVSVSDGSDKGDKKREKSNLEKKKGNSDPEKASSSRVHSTKSRSRSRSPSSKRSGRRYGDHITATDEYHRRKKEAYLREKERHRRDRRRHRSHSRSRSSSYSGSSSGDDRRTRSSSRSRSKSRSSHKSERKSRRSRSRDRRRSQSRSRSRSRPQDHRKRDKSRERDDSRRHGPGPSSAQPMVPYPMHMGVPWGSRPPFRHPLIMPGPPILYPHMVYAPPFRPFPPPFRGAPSEGRVPLFSKIVTVSVSDGSDKGDKKREKSNLEKKKGNSDPEKASSSRVHSTKSRSRSRSPSSKRSGRRYGDHITATDEYHRRKKEAYLREIETSQGSQKTS